MPIPKGVLQVADKDYGDLSPYIKKLAYQIEWGIPMHKALLIFADDTDNNVINRSISIIIEADQSGGNIGDILQSVSTSVINIKKLKEERRNSIASQVVQGYLVFIMFIIIMLVLELVLFPKLTTT
jgi:pilus assembly protein TadC